MKILFMGTPDYAAVTLEKIIEAGHEVCGVFAQPDKPVGRKHILTPPPVKVMAQERGIEVFQPQSFKDGEALRIIERLAPELIVVVAYGKILPESVLSFPKYSCINAHASILPAYRGASPIQWAIVCGEKQTGVTIQYMDSGVDTGDIIDTEIVDIGDEETADELFQRLSHISADLTVRVIEKIANGTAKRTAQDHSKATHAPIIKKEMAQLSFEKNANELNNAVRGYYSWPCAFFFLNGKRIKVTKAKPLKMSHGKQAGTVLENKESLVIACADNTALEILSVIPEGAKLMSAQSMLMGNKIALGSIIGE